MVKSMRVALDESRIASDGALRLVSCQAGQRPSMKAKTKETFRKVAISVVGILMIAALVYLTSATTQSRFVAYSDRDTPVFIDKYVEPGLCDDFAANLDAATFGFLAQAELLATRPSRGPVGYFAADRHYGVINANDPLVKRRLKGRPSSDFALFRSISINFYANELVSKSLAAQDGSYVFVNIDQHWRASVLHAYTHAIAAANAPESMRPAFIADATFDPQLKFAFRFIDEAFALLSSDLYDLSITTGLEQAWTNFRTGTATRYVSPTSDVLEREEEIVMATYDMPQKTVEFYGACNAYAASLIERHGKDAVCQVARRFLTGTYASLDELFSTMGGLSATITAWKGDATIPR